MISSLRCANFLSFDSASPALELRSLNVLIGPNGSGKSNLVEALGLLKSAPDDLARPLRERGVVAEWVWLGAKPGDSATIEAVVKTKRHARDGIRYRLSFRAAGQGFEVADERAESAAIKPGKPKPYLYFGFENGRPMINVKGQDQARELRREDIDPQHSILAQRKDPDYYPELTSLGQRFGDFRLYRDWRFGRDTPPRLPQPADLPNDHLSEDARNLGLVLNRLRLNAGVKAALHEHLKEFDDRLRDVDIRVQGGTVQVFVQEDGWTIPATRLSDGCLRWLSLLAVLLDPDPPALVCIEEPEMGLHPDIVTRLAALLVDASTRTQLVVTTHSDVLVDALSDDPEVVVTCEKQEGATRLRRLQRGELSAWLEKYTVGQLWRSGEIGANRW